MIASKLALVPFVNVENMMRLISDIGIEEIFVELVEYLEEDFLKWPQFDKTPRVASHSKEGVIELMPTSDGVNYGFKYVNGHPKNMQNGFQTVTAFGLLASVDTGYPTLLTEMTILTALRTAATSALATKYLARTDAKSLALIGNGAQSEFQALALKKICEIHEVRLFDIDRSASKRCAQNLEGSGISVIVCKTAEEAILGADVITTCTADKLNATVLTDNMIGAGVHINAIGGDCPGKTELHHDILNRSTVFVEYPEQTRIEGEIQQMPDTFPVTELWQVMNGDADGRMGDRQITLFDGVGFAIEDFSALRWLQDKVRSVEWSDYLDIIADPDDPRDLYGMVLRAHKRNQKL
tara:strand:- start:3224 stop:4282 length:1059 start_codon:yes stop_codon:yes gene_type:complete